MKASSKATTPARPPPKTAKKPGMNFPVAGESPSAAKDKAVEFKNAGNLAFQKGDYLSAIHAFTRGLELDPGNPNNYIFYSNRSAAFFALPDFRKALEDAETVITLRPDWPKGYSRKGAALVGCKELDKAIQAYREGLAYDPQNALLLEGLEVAQNALSTQRSESQVQSPPKLPPNPTMEVSVAATSSVPRVAPSSSSQLGPLLPLVSLSTVEAEWTLLTFKDRIWLHEDGVPFRPQTALLCDLSRVLPEDTPSSSSGCPNCMGLKQNHSRKPWAVAELLEMVVAAALNAKARPSTVAITDERILAEAQPFFEAAGIACVGKSSTAPGPARKAITRYIATAEAQEEASWVAANCSPRQSNTYSSLIWKRRQAGMLKTPATHPHLVANLLRNAAAYFRSELYKKFTGYVEMLIPPNTTSSIISIVGTGNAEHGIAKYASVQDMLDSETGAGQAVSFLFTEVTSIPFDDVDDIEHYQWEIAGPGAFPLFLVYNNDRTTLRPAATVLEWFELAFGALLGFGQNTYLQPGYVEDPTKKLTIAMNVPTYLGPIRVDITLPPRTGSGVTPLAPPKAEGVAFSGEEAPPPTPAFFPAVEFEGARPGFVFQAGPNGVGYYPDTYGGCEPQAPPSFGNGLAASHSSSTAGATGGTTTVSSAQLAALNAKGAFLRAQESRLRSSTAPAAAPAGGVPPSSFAAPTGSGSVTSTSVDDLNSETSLLREQLATALRMLSEERNTFSSREESLKQEIRAMQFELNSVSKQLDQAAAAPPRAVAGTPALAAVPPATVAPPVLPVPPSFPPPTVTLPVPQAGLAAPSIPPLPPYIPPPGQPGPVGLPPSLASPVVGAPVFGAPPPTLYNAAGFPFAPQQGLRPPGAGAEAIYGQPPRPGAWP
eukprot:RCo007825